MTDTPAAASPDDHLIEATMLAMVDACEAGKSIGPTDVAIAIGGSHPDGWGPLMTPIRRLAVTLAKQGRIVILRKGKPADPDAFKGVYRLGRVPVE